MLAKTTTAQVFVHLSINYKNKFKIINRYMFNTDRNCQFYYKSGQVLYYYDFFLTRAEAFKIFKKVLVLSGNPLTWIACLYNARGQRPPFVACLGHLSRVCN